MSEPTTNPRWTDETADLVAHAIHVADCEWSWDDCRSEKAHGRSVRAILTDLADAGLLVPADGGRADDWRVIYRDGLHWKPVVWSENASRESGAQSLARAERVGWPSPELQHRTVITTPWVEVTDRG